MNYRIFYPKKLSLSSQKYGFEITNPGVIKARIQDPGSGSATLALAGPVVVVQYSTVILTP
jgi:hypothetical protein